MQKLKQLSLTVAVAGVLSSGAAMAELTGNIGVTSNYLWRGVTQTSDSAAISGGLDYAHKSGAYAGTWASEVSSLNGESGQYELDLYVGYTGDAGSVSYDVGVIKYIYPIDDGGTVQVDADFTEVYVSAGFGPATLYLASTLSKEGDPQFEKDMYFSLSADFKVAGLGMTALYGDYDFDDPAGTDYSHYSLGLSKDDFTFALEQNDITGADDVRVVVSWSKEISL
ncbi:MAG: TorF family putative porin [Gammaproteobacteria bacterium]|nr:TorF family putative porin [Gammaproteobacteria bacterium]